MKKELIQKLLDLGYILANGNEIDDIVDYINASNNDSVYTINDWIRDTIYNFPEMLIKLI